MDALGERSRATIELTATMGPGVRRDDERGIAIPVEDGSNVVAVDFKRKK